MSDVASPGRCQNAITRARAAKPSVNPASRRTLSIRRGSVAMRGSRRWRGPLRPGVQTKAAESAASAPGPVQRSFVAEDVDPRVEVLGSRRATDSAIREPPLEVARERPDLVEAGDLEIGGRASVEERDEREKICSLRSPPCRNAGPSPPSPPGGRCRGPVKVVESWTRTAIQNAMISAVTARAARASISG